MRKFLKKPLKTSKGVSGRVNECRRLAKGNHEMMIKIIKQSVDNEWLNFYELKTHTNNYQSNNKPTFAQMLQEEEGYGVEDIIYGSEGNIDFT